jgi:4-amino-4-deoxy-L-arabinose transferase-like glycosyltransferase
MGLFVIVWLATLGSRSLVSADEGRYASLSLAMLQTGDWITPRLNGLLYFEKPPLQYWAGAAAMALLGINEFAARLWPGLCGLAIVGLCSLTARRLWGARVGLHALLIAGSTTWIVANSHFLSLDTGLTAALTLVMCSLLLGHAAPKASAARSRWMLAAWVGMALATLSKGPIGLVIPGASLLLHSLWRRDVAIWRELQWRRGPLVFLLIAAPWFLLVSARNPDFLSFFLIHEHFQRFLTPQHRREGAWWYFLPFLLVGFMPWTSALPWLWRIDRKDFATSFLLVWSLFILGFFSASSSKLPSYILPMFPALVLLLARLTARAQAAVLKKHLLFPALLWAAALVAVPFAGRLAGGNRSLAALQALSMGVGAGAAICLLGTGLAWALLARKKTTEAMACVAISHLFAVLLILGSHDSFGQLKSSDRIARLLAPLITPTTPIFAVQDYDHTLPFYLRRPVMLVAHRDEFEFGQAREPERWIPTLDAFLTRWQDEPRAAAYLSPQAFEEMRRRGLDLRIVYADPRRTVVVKP